MPDLRTGPDRLIARESGAWAREKLDFLETYLPPALDATLRKVRRVYVDLFAGPGLNVDRESGEPFDGGALRALRQHGASHPESIFTDATLVNVDQREHEALEARINRLSESGEGQVPRDRTQTKRGDANTLLPEILRGIPTRDYIFVFADPESPSQWPWSSVEALRAQGHESIDLYLLFPLEMGIRRLLDFKGAERTRYGATITAFFGCRDWEPIVRARATTSQKVQMLRRLHELYLDRLRGHWSHVTEVAIVARTGEAGLYRMIFASDHPAGQALAGWARRKQAQARAQPRLNPDW